MSSKFQEIILYKISCRPFTFSLEGSSKPGHKNMSSRESPRGSFQWRGQNKGRHMCGNKRRPDSSTSARNCSESPASKSCLALGLDFPPHFTKAWEERWRRQPFFSLVMKNNDTQTVSCIFFQYCLCFKSGEKQMNAEDSGWPTKKCVSLNKIQN